MDYQKEISHLDKQLNFLNEIILAIAPDKIGFLELTSVIGPILKLNLDTGKSIKLLAENNHLRDLIILSRPFIESIINVGFICAKGVEAIIKSKKYAYQKGYRDLFRELKLNDFEIKNGLTPHKEFIDQHRPENLVEALEEYTTKKGNEKTSWADETAKQKVEEISKQYGVWVNGLLTFAFFNIYRDVSEIIHGSYYGVLIMTGMQNKDITAFKTSDEAAEYFTDHQFKLGTLIVQQVSISIVAIIEILNQVFIKLPTINGIKEKSYGTLVEYADNAFAKEPL
jgi:hypothetical protein